MRVAGKDYQMSSLGAWNLMGRSQMMLSSLKMSGSLSSEAGCTSGSSDLSHLPAFAVETRHLSSRGFLHYV